MLHGLCFGEEAGARHLVCSTLLGAAAACVILLSLAAEHRKSYWSGYIQAAIVIPVLELQFPILSRVVLLCFATQCLQIAL